MVSNYSKICEEIISGLPQRQKEIILRRFGLSGVSPAKAERAKAGALGEGGPKRETLESIGQDFSITRERVRQIQDDGLEKIKPKIKNYNLLFRAFKNYFQNFGDLKKEEIALKELGKGKWQNQIYFLLSLGDGFERFGETEDLYSTWTTNKNSLNKAKEVISHLYQELEKIGKPLALNELTKSLRNYSNKLPQTAFASYLEISKKIQKNRDNLFGFKSWPEINPRGVKDKAYIVFKKENRPLHFQEVASLIENSLVQTVHNELIRDPRFVLIGRGIYALRDWGYEPGQVKDVVLRILRATKKPLPKEEILKQVREQRMVKENTILLNLSNKKYFLKNSQGKYTIREV